MSFIFALPAALAAKDPGVALTFIVPATECNLKCSFCAIKQRNEVGATRLRPNDYARFLTDIVKEIPTAIASVQGYEPLLEESWEYTRAILSAGRAAGIPTSLVTNGTNLNSLAGDLASLDPTGVSISIDSANHRIHDGLRGVPGALARTLEGVQRLVAIPGYCDRISISSVLLPNKREHLEGMPELLSMLGLSYWVINPIFRIGSVQFGGTVSKSSKILDDIRHLQAIANQYNVKVILDDELGDLGAPLLNYEDLVVRRFERPDGLIRLTPSGACSKGRDILKQVNSSTKVWDPSRDAPAEFLRSLVGADRVVAAEDALA